MADFQRAVDFVIEHEIRDDSGWTPHDPDDPGGRTRWGVASRWHPNVDLDSLTRSGAEDFYRREFWVPLRGDDLPEPLGLVMLDWAVPHGVRTATRALQGVLGVYADGRIGQQTLAAVRARDPKSLARQLIATRKRAIQQIHSGKYEAGWLARLVDVALAAL